MSGLPRPVWVRTDDGRVLPGWCRAVRRGEARRWLGFVAYTDRSSGLQYLHWLDQGVLSTRTLAA